MKKRQRTAQALRRIGQRIDEATGRRRSLPDPSQPSQSGSVRGGFSIAEIFKVRDRWLKSTSGCAV